MSKIYSFIFILSISVHAEASNYYFSSTTGSDSRTSQQAQNKATPWKSTAKLNSWFTHLQPGDSALFLRGDSFPGPITVLQSGTASLPIVLAAYGPATAGYPQFSGLVHLSDWTSKGNGIWESPCPSCGASVNTVLLNGAAQVMGRYPNSNAPSGGYLQFVSHSGTSAITSNVLSTSSNWAGAQLVLRPNRWVIDRDSILGQTGSTLSYASVSGYTPIDSFGFFIQNSISTLDLNGEWYYNPAAKALDMYFGNASPLTAVPDVWVSSVNNLVSINGQNYLTFHNLSFLGSNQEACLINDVQNITFSQCSFRYAGSNAVTATNTTGLSLISDSLLSCNNTALSLAGNCNKSLIKSNYINNTGIHAGMGQSGNDTYAGILISGTGNTVAYNTIDSTGYIGIDFSGDSTLIQNNFINYFTLSKDDGGGIYTWTGASNLTPSAARTILGNIVLNGVGAGAGTDQPDYFPSEGIYMDDNTGFVTITGNSVANCGDNGILLHNSHDITVSKNTLYNNTRQLDMAHDAICPNCPITQVSMHDNILCSKWIDQTVIGLESSVNDLKTYGSFDSNYYCRPYDDRFCLYNTFEDSGAAYNLIQDLGMWQSALQQDGASKKSPVTYAPYAINSFTGPEMFSNSSFTSNITGLYSYSALNNALVSWDNTGVLDGGCLKFYFSPSSGLLNTSKIIIAVGAVTAGSTYVVSFSLKGTKNNKAMDLFIRQSNSPFNNLSETEYCQINTTRTENQFLFTALASETNASLVFEITEPDSTLWLDNILMQEATVTTSNPNDNILFEYNATNSIQSVALPGTYVDVKNRPYSNLVDLAPYASVVLLRDAAPMGIKRHEPVTVSVNLFPNPVSSLLTIGFSAGLEAESLVQVIDLEGRVVLTNNVPVNAGMHELQLDIHALRPALYFIRISSKTTVCQQRFVKMETE